MFKDYSRQSEGKFSAFVYKGNKALPIEDAKVIVNDDNGNLIAELMTDSSGQTEEIMLPAPRKELSLSPGAIVPYSKYSIIVKTETNDIYINGVQNFASIESVQPVQLDLEETATTSTESFQHVGSMELIQPTLELERTTRDYNISEHTLLSPEVKLTEEEINDLIPTKWFPFLFLDPKIPSHIVVHDGHPNDKNAKNYTVDFKSYITNVACCEINYSSLR